MGSREADVQAWRINASYSDADAYADSHSKTHHYAYAQARRPNGYANTDAHARVSVGVVEWKCCGAEHLSIANARSQLQSRFSGDAHKRRDK